MFVTPVSHRKSCANPCTRDTYNSPVCHKHNTGQATPYTGPGDPRLCMEMACHIRVSYSLVKSLDLARSQFVGKIIVTICTLQVDVSVSRVFCVCVSIYTRPGQPECINLPRLIL